jgi:hypothetical protein
MVKLVIEKESRRRRMSLRHKNTIVIPGSLLILSVAVVFLVGWPAPAAPAPVPQNKQWAAEMPEGDGKTLIVTKCQICHTLERVVTSHRTKDDWEVLVELMVEQGAPITDNESKTVVEYLFANYGPRTTTKLGDLAPAPRGSEVCFGLMCIVLDNDLVKQKRKP